MLGILVLEERAALPALLRTELRFLQPARVDSLPNINTTVAQSSVHFEPNARNARVRSVQAVP